MAQILITIEDEGHNGVAVLCMEKDAPPRDGRPLTAAQIVADEIGIFLAEIHGQAGLVAGNSEKIKAYQASKRKPTRLTPYSNN